MDVAAFANGQTDLVIQFPLTKIVIKVECCPDERSLRHQSTVQNKCQNNVIVTA